MEPNESIVSMEERTHPIEISATDLVGLRVISMEVVRALAAADAPKSRERSLAITKLQEAGFWLMEASAREA